MGLFFYDKGVDMRFISKHIFLSILCLFYVSTLHADESNVDKSKLKRTVTLKSPDNKSIDIAILELMKQQDGSYNYSLDIDDDKFSNHFLSMRPFKCFQGPKQMLCYLPYPYKKTYKISDTDLQDLEYDLLFIHRKASDYGINPWNGLYYKLSLNQDAKLTGVLNEVDLDILAAPPDEGVTRPITDSDLTLAEQDSYSYPVLTIH